MNYKLKNTALFLFYLFVAGYATVLVFSGATNILRAEERNYRLENIEKRVAEYDALKIDQRLTRVETILADFPMDHDWFKYAGDGGIGLLLLRAIYADVKQRKRGPE